MLEAVLFDLDDTLLGNNINRFLRSYFPLLAKYMGHLVEPEQFLRDLLASTQVMMGNANPQLTNQDVFWADFSTRTGLRREELEPTIDEFYRTEFTVLRETTERRPEAALLVELCRLAGWKVAIATNPLFPRRAIDQRLEWAGIGGDRFTFDLVTAYENMHATKPHEAYYREILELLDTAPERALMVGDDWDNDIVPAADLGLSVFWVAEAGHLAPEARVAVDAQGAIGDLLHLLEAGWLQSSGAT